MVNPQSAVSVQAKLKEARDSGTKLDYESLVLLLKNHSGFPIEGGGHSTMEVIPPLVKSVPPLLVPCPLN